MSLDDIDEFRVEKIFPDDTMNPKFYKFKIGEWDNETDEDDRRQFRRHYSSCPKGPDKTHSVVTTEWEKSHEDFVDQEVTGYFYLPQIESDQGKPQCYKYKPGGKGSSLTIKLRGSRHSGKKDPKTAKCYIFDFQFEGGDDKNFQKEYPHPTYFKMTVDTKFILKNNLKKWVGYKVVTINQEDAVRCIALVDYGSENRSKDEGPDLDKQNWIIYYDVTDDGKLDEKYKISNEAEYKKDKEKREPWKFHFEDKVIQFRMDRIVQPEAKFLSARRISGESIDEIVKSH